MTKDPKPARPILPALTIVDPDDQGDLEADWFEDGIPDDRRVILITGAAGNIGRKLRAAWSGTYSLILIDQHPPAADPDIVAVDLANWDDEWSSMFEGVDVVVHLAANPEESSTWAELVGPNMDAMINVMNAAAFAGVGRIIFASSNHAMGDYRFDGSTCLISEDIPPKPDSPYGGLKLMGERLGRAFAATYELEFIALRIGWNQRGNANLPETLPSEWDRQLWLSDDDLISLFTRAVEAELPDTDFIVVNGMSNNTNSRWTQDQARALIGYEAKDDSEA
jgi:nucleoside-diphosphate-sugar epimerase